MVSFFSFGDDPGGDDAVILFGEPDVIDNGIAIYWWAPSDMEKNNNLEMSK